MYFRTYLVAVIATLALVQILAHSESLKNQRAGNGVEGESKESKCITLWEPVCGCDGIVHGNSCEAGNKVMCDYPSAEQSGGNCTCPEPQPCGY